ncbi:hypothetical protein BBJ28_00013743 [Nothophytophthora sp. Chile5]|nr:hypothetical protein BBJ28_00013743 [Nothophytophthora sp. Chile5]
MQRGALENSSDAFGSISLEKRAMERSGSATASSTSPSEGSGRGGKLSFSTFLMDEVLSPVQLSAASSRPAPPPVPSLPPLRSQAAVNGVNGEARQQQKAANPRRRGESDVDIPVLEAARDSCGFRLDGADRAELDVSGDGDDDDEAHVVVGEYDAEEDDFVPVLQTAEDALRAHRRLGSKKFSWRASARRSVPIGSAKPVRVPDQETLLRMSGRPTEQSSSYASSNSLSSRRSSSNSMRIDHQLVRSGWLYKQANVMYVLR